MNPALLDIVGLGVMFHTEAGPRNVLRDISLQVRPGEILGLVGESPRRNRPILQLVAGTIP